MPTLTEKLATLKQLQDSGQVEKANALLEEIQGDAQAAEKPAVETPAAPAPPRDPSEVIIDLFKSVGNHLGNQATLVQLIAELENSFKSSKVPS